MKRIEIINYAFDRKRNWDESTILRSIGDKAKKEVRNSRPRLLGRRDAGEEILHGAVIDIAVTIASTMTPRAIIGRAVTG